MGAGRRRLSNQRARPWHVLRGICDKGTLQAAHCFWSLVFRLTQDAIATQEDIIKWCRFDASRMRRMLLYVRTERSASRMLERSHADMEQFGAELALNWRGARLPPESLMSSER